MKFKKNINPRIGKLWVNMGWYSGDPFRVFLLEIGQHVNGLDMIVIFSIQVALLSFTIGLDL